MPLRNRVTPLGELIADPARGLVYGNRGCLHDDRGEIRRRFATRRWIACRLEFSGWQRTALMQPGKFTELFFLDEATALAAGHRPCALCRREDYRRFLGVVGATGADEIDERLHRERLDGHGRRFHAAALDDLPDGTFVLHDAEPWLLRHGALLRWTPAGYGDRIVPSRRRAQAITPPSLVDLLRSGWEPVVPLLHASAG
ncbi:MAG: hypothetical protein ACM3QU_04035 [Verrucomicrobiota bacterium]